MHPFMLTKVLAFNTNVTVSPPNPNAIFHHIFKKDPFGGSNIEPATDIMCKTFVSCKIVNAVRVALNSIQIGKSTT